MSRRKKIDCDANRYLEGSKFPPVMHGLQGVMDMFGVSKATASRYVRSFLREAVTKRGNVFLIDTEQALRCFGVKNPKGFIKVDRSSR